jgi:cell division septal protein FtsQ
MRDFWGSRMSTSTRRRAPPRSRAGTRRGGVHPIVPSILVLLLCLVALGVAFAGVFKVRTVEVVGLGLPRARILAAAGVSDANIFMVKSDVVVARLSSVRAIVVTGVQTSFPDRVIIHAQVRPSLVAWQTPAGLFVLDMDGRVIDRVARTTLPIIVGADRNGGLGPGIVQAVRYAVQALPPAPKGAIAIFRYDQKSGLTIAGRAGWHAVVGTGGPAELVQRIAELAAVLQKAPTRSESLVTLDLRYPKPVARFAQP